MSFADLYARHALASFDKQVYLEAMLGRKRAFAQTANGFVRCRASSQ